MLTNTKDNSFFLSFTVRGKTYSQKITTKRHHMIKALAKRTRKYTVKLKTSGSTCDCRPCVHLRWLAMTCAHFGRDQICTQVEASFSHFGHPTQPKLSDAHWRIISQWNAGYVCCKMGFFATRVYLWGNLPVRLATQRQSLRKFNLRPLATTCRSVWPRLNTKNL